ncbi:MAG: HAMP domain-containing protein [Sandaracinus sp.]|nr:HAMP domain-containing protein [Sandaracinus sp.]MCB9611962.1 HAMP domain-containing protein [Sandaracinus sp.]
MTRWPWLGRIRVRLLVVNLFVVLVPVAGLELAKTYERQLLEALERDMRDQAVVARRFVEASLRRGGMLDDPAHEEALRRSARRTRTRIRLLDTEGRVVVDSHRDGPPEGPEPRPPWLASASPSPQALAPWPEVVSRSEVRDALRGRPSGFTRLRDRNPGVLLFVTEPIQPRGAVVGVVYAVRSTSPVLVELHRIRSGLLWVLGGAVLFTLLVTLALAWSISRPLEHLSKAAKRIAAGERDVPVPIEGGGEIAELGESFAAMTRELDARLTYLSAFAADVAHEFKSPLTSIRGAAELLAEGAADDPKARERFLGNILLDVERLDRHVTRLLELSRIEAGAADTARQLVSLRPLVEASASRASTEDVRVEVAWQAKASVVHARAMDLDAALGNLLENAVRFSPAGSAVKVKVVDVGRFVELAVEDEGPGVPEEDRAKIFERFFTTDAERRGTGLGLAITRAVAEAHGGSLRFEAREPKGSRFVLKLPAGRRRGKADETRDA